MINLKKLKFVAMLSLALIIAVPDCFSEVLEEDSAVAYASFIKDLFGSTQTKKEGMFCGFGSDEVFSVIAENNENFIDLNRDPTKYESCKAIYVARGKEKGLRVEIEKFNKNKIMTIGTFDDFTEIGGMIQVQIGRRNFELILNLNELKAAGVRLNALANSLVVN
jgi:hypothetical protein